MKKRIRIAVDMDDVLADTFAEQLRWLRLEYGYELTPEMLAGRDLSDLIPRESFQRLEEMMRQGNFFADLPAVAGSQQVLQELAERYEIFIGTAAMEYPASFTPKFRWLAEHFPFIQPSHIVFCGDKSVLSSDFLIDDNARHFSRFCGQGVLFTAPHNTNVSGYPRVDNWDDVRQMFRVPSAR